uniref:Putative piezo-type mechanosensitive ion channel component n=1 Tax=Anopheles darlingi TaxID=43151 RepID=A0A2M4DQC8_ANODA
MNSYIFTNVIMMVWSIMYHSWLTFVLLIWANLIWIMPNHRKNMLKSSPVLVIYAELLLLAQYLYGMNLTEEELPTVIDGSSFNLEELGFVRRLEYPCVPLLVKSLFTTMFWISLRQQIQEKHTERRESMIANMASPIQLPIGAATTAAKTTPSTTEHRAHKNKGVRLCHSDGKVLQVIYDQILDMDGCPDTLSVCYHRKPNDNVSYRVHETQTRSYTYITVNSQNTTKNDALIVLHR